MSDARGEFEAWWHKRLRKPLDNYTDVAREAYAAGLAARDARSVPRDPPLETRGDSHAVICLAVDAANAERAKLRARISRQRRQLRQLNKAHALLCHGAAAMIRYDENGKVHRPQQTSFGELCDALDAANAQNAALREALREQCLITPASLVLENPDAPFVSTGCLLCNGRWEPDQPERHAPRCLCEEPK